MNMLSFISSLFTSAPTKKTRVLFIVKKRTLPHYDQIGKTVSTGLKNSAAFVNEMLNRCESFDSDLVEVVDNNCIDKYVSSYKPDIVIIEALWVIPEKFQILKKLHPKVKWIVRLHSDTPFLANEGNAIDWIQRCSLIDNVFIAANSYRIYKELIPIIGKSNIVYLPNYYPLNHTLCDELKDAIDFAKELMITKRPTDIHIGCFGAIRPMKNHLLQAITAIAFANKLKKKLYFHINSNRCEGNGDPVLKNLRSLFTNTPHQLVEHPWMDHSDFLTLIGLMDISMQVSLSETFNIVTCDAVSQNVPVVVSPEISWVSSLFQAKPTSSLEIFDALTKAWQGRKINLQKINLWNLEQYNTDAKRHWKNELEKIK